jgi:voltage-gated potassium channel Kch
VLGGSDLDGNYWPKWVRIRRHSTLYYFLPSLFLFPTPADLFYRAPVGFFEAFYFSGVTLATLGYGDIAPIHLISRALALYEVALGIFLVVVAIATYVSAPVGTGSDAAK